MQHEVQRCPVTAVAFYRQDVLLAGEGNYLKVHRADGHHPSARVKPFDNQAIHGILALSARNGALVWGGRWLRLVTISRPDGDTNISLGPLEHADDWILDVALTPGSHGGTQSAALITAHNALWTLRVGPWADDDNGRISSLSCNVSGSNCILYSAHLKWLSGSHCLIASGTAFGDVVLWSAFFEDGTSGTSARSQIHYTFSAHEGSVFGVQISSPSRLPSLADERRILASCSDDRSVRLWDVSDRSVESASLTQVQRDTGFGSRSDGNARAPPLLAKVMAHTSRIWHVRFMDRADPEDTGTQIVSCGEDTFVNTWQMKPSSSSPPVAMEHISSRSSHSGKNIWSVAQHEKTGAFATGGADGAICCYSNQTNTSAVAEIGRSLLDTVQRSNTDNFKAYAFVSDTALLSTTEQGRIIIVDLKHDTSPVTEISHALPGLQGYSVVTSLDGFAFVSGTHGVTYSYSHHATADGEATFSMIAQRPGKTAGLFPSRLDEKTICLLATGVGAVAPSLYTIDTDGEGAAINNSRVGEKRLQLPKDFIVTSFTICGHSGNTFAVLGSRAGSLAIYRLLATDADSIEASTSIDNVHGKEAVTSLCTTWHSRSSSDSKSTYLLSTGRDGTLAVHNLTLHPLSPPQLRKVHQLPLPFGPNIEHLYISSTSNISCTNRLSISGFRGKHLIHYDAVSQQEILRVECGGAHRNWAFRPGLEGGTFVWTKASKVYYHRRLERECRMTNAGGHGREIKALAVSSNLASASPDGGGGGQIIATGAEDTDIKLFHLLSNPSSTKPSTPDMNFKPLATLRKHNTGIQHLSWHDNYLFSSGGFEEFFIWRITPDVPFLGVGVVCVAVHPRCGRSEVRVCGFDVRRLDCEDDEVGAEGWKVTMVYSDSAVRVWRLRLEAEVEDGRWELVWSGEYLTSCLTHVVRPPPLAALSTENTGEMITAATDGHLAFWMEDEGVSKLNWHARHRVHHSAIHTLTSFLLQDGSTLIATGGDDGAVALTRTACDSQRGAEVKTLLISRAHAAAVTGLVALPKTGPEGSQGGFWLATVGLDQRVKLWDLTVDAGKKGVEGVEVKKRQSVYTSVADVSSLDLVTLAADGTGRGVKGVLVCGVGMDVWRLPTLAKEE